METSPEVTDDAATLDPPGSIAVVGAGPLGIEAALYGRFLGYDVTLFEAFGVAHSISDRRDEAIEVMPDRCLSPLAKSALQAQAGDAEPKALPVTIGQWIDQVWLPLTQTDLLRGRLRCPATVVSVTLVPIAGELDEGESADQADEAEDAVPPDFRLTLAGGESDDFEAVILATGVGGQQIRRSFPESTDYWFAIGGRQSENAESDFLAGLKDIVAVYASLGGREDLDLYRPLRG